MSKYMTKKSELDEYELDYSQHSFTIRPIANQIDLYLVGSIDGPEKYLPWFNIINKASENDNITVHISSPGGYLSTSLQIFESLVNSSASVEVSIEGECASGASIIMMAADYLTIMPSSYVMIHAYSGGVGGKYNEIMSNSHFSEKWFSDVVKYVYEGFLSSDEMTQVLDGKDLYITADDVVSRYTEVLKNRKARVDALKKKRDDLQAEMEKVITEKNLLKLTSDDTDDTATKPVEKSESSKPKKETKSKKKE